MGQPVEPIPLRFEKMRIALNPMNPLQASRSPRHAYSHPDYEERPDGAESRQQRADEAAEQRSGGGGGGGQTSIVPTQKMLQDKYEQNLK